MKKKLLATLLTSAFVLGGTTIPTFASGIVADPESEMYATGGSTGSAVARYRTDINSALGNDKNGFYSVANHNFSKFTFDKTFFNVDGSEDIEFSEVTWGSWHEEAVEVYLVNPKIEGESYRQNDLTSSWSNDCINLSATDKEELEKDNLYFAGVAFNKTVVENGNVSKYTGNEGYEGARFKEILAGLGNSEEDAQREFVENNLKTDGDIQITGFNLPDEVTSAEGIVLVDITGKINSNRPDLAKDDGFDLASIKVYGQKSTGNDDSNGGTSQELVATGKGDSIVDGSWLNQTKISLEEIERNGKVEVPLILQSGEEVGYYTVSFNSNGSHNKIVLDYEITNTKYKFINEKNDKKFAISNEAFTTTNLDELKGEDKIVGASKAVTLKKQGITDEMYIYVNLPIALTSN